MRQRDRLRLLQVGIARHYRGGVLLGAVAKNGNQLAHQSCRVVGFVTQVHARIECYLIVTAARRMQSFSYVSEALCQHRFNEHMYILGVGIELQRPRFKVCKYSLKSADDLFGVGLRNYPLCAQHCGVCHASANILAVHFLIEPDGRIKVIRDRVRHPRRPPRPHFF